MSDTLQELWQASDGDQIIELPESVVLKSELNLVLAKFNKAIKKRNFREVAAALVLIPFVVWGLFTYDTPLTRIALIIELIHLTLIIAILVLVKKQMPDKYELPVRDYLVLYKAYLIREKKLLQTVFYWYLLPGIIAISLFYIDQSKNTYLLFTLFALSIWFWWFVYRINKKAAEEQVQPLITQVDKTLEELENDN